MGCTGCKKKIYKDYGKKLDRKTNIVVTVIIVVIGLAVYGLFSIIFD